MIVRETSEDLIHRIVDFRRSVMAGLPSWGTDISSAVVQPQEAHPNPFHGGLPPWIRARLVESFWRWPEFSQA